MDVKIIGRSSGRSATGAAAYRAGEKLHSVAHASYQAGEKLQGTVNKNDKITHDYTRKKGIVHSEIILPKNAPSKYTDRQTLWNAVELSETRKNSQLAREIIIALPIEFNLQEHLEVIRKYAKDNFVDKGMIADFAIHDTENDNPHAHIMLTTRNVTQEGFSEKNREWNKKENLLEWRKAWAHVVNEVFERKGLAQRIDHRTLKAQGIDRKPMIHLGYKASALEKK
ncbi:MAG: MobA/MobL family protein, partial [Candidatus Bathyarchaeota archaeon]|uniref:MobQ family relaxase n=1 Tax=Candidatus Bathycorpusculum sp. TaxID=2994959 RepID=UPI002836DBAC|nr:MobA/MobL family protein [Candidatus Termiticorpusculum sp.]